jgi:hypothetical protein
MEELGLMPSHEERGNAVVGDRLTGLLQIAAGNIDSNLACLAAKVSRGAS